MNGGSVLFSPFGLGLGLGHLAVHCLAVGRWLIRTPPLTSKPHPPSPPPPLPPASSFPPKLLSFLSSLLPFAFSLNPPKPPYFSPSSSFLPLRTHRRRRWLALRLTGLCDITCMTLLPASWLVTLITRWSLAGHYFSSHALVTSQPFEGVTPTHISRDDLIWAMLRLAFLWHSRPPAVEHTCLLIPNRFLTPNPHPSPTPPPCTPCLPGERLKGNQLS